MKLLHSSTSSSEPLAGPGPAPSPGRRTLLAIPRPTPATWSAAATFVIIGAALSHVAGLSHGVPPSAVSGSDPGRAYWYNAANRPRRADVILLGDSLMELGVIPGLFASSLGLEPDSAKNLAISGAGPWDVEWIAGRLDEPKADGPRLAVIEVDPAWFDLEGFPMTGYAIARGGGGLPGPSRDRLRRALGRFVPERREARDWLLMVAYNWLGYRIPRLIRPPVPAPPEVWDLSPEAQKKAVEAVARRMRRSLAGGEFADHSVEAIRLAVDHLKRRGYRVVLFLTPLRRDVLAAMAKIPSAVDRDRRMRAAIGPPARLGADALIEVRDATALGAEDDAIFMDYGHLNRDGAGRLTRKLAAEVLRLGLLSPRP